MSIADLAIEKTLSGLNAYCKFLTPNDSGESGAHQAGFLISKTAKNMLFSEEELSNHIAKKNVEIKWQDDFYTEGCFTWYESKNELRITRFTHKFPYLGATYTGALFVLIKNDTGEYYAFILNTEDEINQYLDAFGITPAETNRPIDQQKVNSSVREELLINQYINGLQVDFPSSDEMSRAARIITYGMLQDKGIAITNPDRAITTWTNKEYVLYRALERSRYGATVASGFHSVDDFVAMANQVLNRRKSRAGKSLEHHLSAVFDENAILYTPQATTEGNKRPDFLFPSEKKYHDLTFPVDRLTTLAAKTTCKDRWRQILNEADRLRDGRKYLCTLQQGISAMQMDEMESERVTLVVPKDYIYTYPQDRRDRIWTVSRFVEHVKQLQND